MCQHCINSDTYIIDLYAVLKESPNLQTLKTESCFKLYCVQDKLDIAVTTVEMQLL